jgi:hypothetical protein
MVSPEHIDNQKPENEQAPSPAEEKQVPTVVENKRAWLKPLMRTAGAVMPLIGGFASIWVTFIPSDYLGLELIGAFLLGAVCAVLFRSGWAILVIPIAFTLGVLLAVYLAPVVFSPNPLTIDDVGFGVYIVAIAGSILATLGALIGAHIVMVWERGQQQ